MNTDSILKGLKFSNCSYRRTEPNICHLRREYPGRWLRRKYSHLYSWTASFESGSGHRFILSEVSRNFPSSLNANSVIKSWNMPCMLPFVTFPSLSFLNHPNFPCYIVWTTENVVKLTINRKKKEEKLCQSQNSTVWNCRSEFLRRLCTSGIRAECSALYFLRLASGGPTTRFSELVSNCDGEAKAQQILNWRRCGHCPRARIKVNT